MDRIRPVLLAIVGCLALASPSSVSADTQQATALAALTRQEEPVVLTGATFPALANRPIAEIVVARWNATAAHYEPVPFQIDEKIQTTFPAAPSGSFTETIHDITGIDGGLFDADDELVVRFGDGGDAAPSSAWLPTADLQRFEILVTDPRPDAPVPTRRFYVFTGHDLPTTSQGYVTWNGNANADVESSSRRLEFADRWLLTGFAVEPPCGNGLDIIDRFKGRAGRNLENESENDWNVTSLYMGGISGPIRAIRYVKGAASAINTIHYDVMYRERWERNVMLRVHPLPGIALYFDLLPIPNTRIFTPGSPAGLTVDGVPESAPTTFQPWSVVRGPTGGFVVLYDVPPSPFYLTKRNFYRDDVNYNDAISPLYDDEDNSAYGAQGFEMRDLVGDMLDRIDIRFAMFPLCAGIGDADVGAAYQGLKDQPLVTLVTPESQSLSPIRTLRVTRAGSDLVLDWTAVPGATSYFVLATPDASEAHETWDLLGEVSGPSFVDPGAALVPTTRHYSILGVTPVGTTPW